MYQAAYEDGMLPDNQAIELLRLLREANPSVVLEIGTFFGHTTRRMAEELPAATIHTIDLPLDYSIKRDAVGLMKDDYHLIRRRVPGREFLGQSCASRIVQHFGDTATWDFQQAVGATFFFIDGSHTYDYCKNDSEKCFSLCGGRGTFVWHDFDHPGVYQLISEWRLFLKRSISILPHTNLVYWRST
jgi:hypothetical protein